MATPENCKCHTSKINSEYTCPSAQDFFTDKTLALTGGTGFLGQGIVEKLLRCCPNIKKIILLMRTKKGAKPEERLKSLIQLPVFDQLRETNPKFAEKLSFVSGDLEAEDLGLDQKSRRLLQNEVHFFIHSAACLKFNEHLR
ncbi:unnamed protein product [Clavelina lepadiformis]|uniref:Fatty acyl-CoA reductase n=1 Tax=Clavelina lepadiformis TaxID=159417 RepID=A0ABP0EVW4_CLALP